MTLYVLRQSPDGQVTGDPRRAEGWEEGCEGRMVPGTMGTCTGKGLPRLANTLKMDDVAGLLVQKRACSGHRG